MNSCYHGSFPEDSAAMLQFLPGIIIAQLLTGALIYLSPSITGSNWIVLAGILLVLAILIALWFGSIAKHISKDEIIKLTNSFTKEKEKIRVKAEKDKNKIVEETHKKINKETRRTHGKANLKVGAAFAGAAGVGVLMLITELLTMGLLTLSTAGGALAGYITRTRQESRSAKKQQEIEILQQPHSPKLIQPKK
jgi:Flp pilus assembly protein TadB